MTSDGGKQLSHAKVAPRPRGRPSNLSKFLARQGDLFADAQYRASLEEKYPYLRSLSAAPSGLPDAASAAPASAGAGPLGKPIRILLSTSPTDEAGGA